MDSDLIFKSAMELRKDILNKVFTVKELMEAHLNQIELLNNRINAIVDLKPEQTLWEAKVADSKIEQGGDVGPLHGLPIVIKDTHNVKGFKTTHGSEIYKNNIATEDDYSVKLLRDAGAIIIGKSNVPEFQAGGHTFNELFGTTANPYNIKKTAGGSSGGSAAAISSGMATLADGSDMGASIRTPASYNNLVGLRPSIGALSFNSQPAFYLPLNVRGPIGRTVTDVAVMYKVMLEETNHEKVYQETEETFEKLTDLSSIKLAWSVDMNGLIPVEKEVELQFLKSVNTLKEIGFTLIEDCPDLTGSEEAFRTIRAFELYLSLGKVYEKFGNKLKKSLAQNIAEAEQITNKILTEAFYIRDQIHFRLNEFFKTYDALILPANQVNQFDINEEYPRKINDKPLKNYIEWGQIGTTISLTGRPSVVVPAGFTQDGLPYGFQIVGNINEEFVILKIGYHFEKETQYWKKRPNLNNILA